MRWTRVLAVTVSAAAISAGLSAVSCSPGAQQSAEPAAMTAEQKIAHGRYLASIMGCYDCHTPGAIFGAPDTTRTLAGSEVGWTGPWGTSYAKNLTPDPETGIGNWSEADIEKALRSGVRPDGSPLLPPMPWPNLSGMSADDMAALIAYLKSIPAVKHANPAVLPPGKKGDLPAIVFPPPPAWDAMNLPPPPDGSAH